MTEKSAKPIIEPALDPDLPIIDVHHHLWPKSPVDGYPPYEVDALIADQVASGHNVIATVYIDAHQAYRTDGPEKMRPVGETEWVESIAQDCQKRGGVASGICAAMATHADMLLGEAVGEVLDAHMAASPRFRGIRFMTAFAAELPPILGALQGGLMTQPAFSKGVAELARRDLSLDAWLLQDQLPELLALARALPDAKIILDHLGGPRGTGRFAGKAEEAFVEWKRDMTEIATCPNVTLKLGGVNMGQTGLAVLEGPSVATSDALVERQRRHFLTAIDIFGPSRCMFESNAPVDLKHASYSVEWNAFKRMTADMSAADRYELFAGTAIRAYRIDVPARA